MTARAAVILAAGQGTRMKSPTPKVLHPVGGRAMLDRAIDAALELGCDRVVVVVGAHSPAVGEHVAARLGEGAMALQDPPLGTGHAVLAARPALAGFVGDVVITYADCPLAGRRRHRSPCSICARAGRMWRCWASRRRSPAPTAG